MATTPGLGEDPIGSFTILISLGILLGAWSSLSSISVRACILGWGACSGGGGGGGDGATSSVAMICAGNASGCNSGQIISAINTPQFMIRANIDQYLLLVLIPLLDSIRASSNIAETSTIQLQR
jgi:hypothetical protein